MRDCFVAWLLAMTAWREMGDFAGYIEGTLHPGDLVVIVDRQPDIVRRANNSLQPHGMTLKALSVKRIEKYGVGYEIVLCESR
jgi:hypothetical protein